MSYVAFGHDYYSDLPLDSLCILQRDKYGIIGHVLSSIWRPLALIEQPVKRFTPLGIFTLT